MHLGVGQIEPTFGFLQVGRNNKVAPYWVLGWDVWFRERCHDLFGEMREGQCTIPKEAAVWVLCCQH